MSETPEEGYARAFIVIATGLSTKSTLRFSEWLAAGAAASFALLVANASSILAVVRPFCFKYLARALIGEQAPLIVCYCSLY